MKKFTDELVLGVVMLAIAWGIINYAPIVCGIGKLRQSCTKKLVVDKINHGLAGFRAWISKTVRDKDSAVSEKGKDTDLSREHQIGEDNLSSLYGYWKILGYEWRGIFGIDLDNRLSQLQVGSVLFFGPDRAKIIAGKLCISPKYGFRGGVNCWNFLIDEFRMTSDELGIDATTIDVIDFECSSAHPCSMGGIILMLNQHSAVYYDQEQFFFMEKIQGLKPVVETPAGKGVK